MSNEELEAEVLKLDAKARARIAGKLLESLDQIGDTDVDRIWAEEAARRDADMKTEQGRSAKDVFDDAQSRLS